MRGGAGGWGGPGPGPGPGAASCSLSSGRSCACGCASPFSRQFTSGNMCGNPRALLGAAFHWSPRPERRPPIGRAVQPVVALLVADWSAAAGPAEPRPLMCRPCVRSRTGRGGVGGGPPFTTGAGVNTRTRTRALTRAPHSTKQTRNKNKKAYATPSSINDINEAMREDIKEPGLVMGRPSHHEGRHRPSGVSGVIQWD